MSNYVLGGWTQEVSNKPKPEYTYTMYGMITDLKNLMSGTGSGGWSPEQQTRPEPTSPGAKVMWTYGGEGACPDNMPAIEDIDRIVNTTRDKNWDGIDFDNESKMNIENVINVMEELKKSSKTTSYTFLAGWNYNNPGSSTEGEIENENVKKIAEENVSDRFVLMCYGAEMWSMSDIEANVGQALERTIGYVIDKKKVMLALTPHGLNTENLTYFLEQVKSKEIGGLFVWDFTQLKDGDLETIKTTLGINV